MTDARQALFDAVRKTCSPATWSRGIELTRARAVSLHREDDDEVVFLVTRRGGMISREVSLYPEDIDWDCGCDSPERGCEHAAAAVIGWRRAEEAEATGAPAPIRRQGRVGYRFSRDGGALALVRVIVDGDGDEHPLSATLAALAAGRVEGPSFAAAQSDLAVELALGTHRRGRLAEALIDRLFARMAHCADVSLDGEPVTVDPERLSPRVQVEDHGNGFRVRLVEDEALEERFGNGVARCGTVLRPLVAAPLLGRELEEFSRGKHYGFDQVAELVTEVIPRLDRRMPVDIFTSRLPETTAERPRIDLAVERDGEFLRVLPTLVYGDPPRARIDGGKLVHIEGPVPVRDAGAEKGAQRRLQKELGLQPGVRAEFRGAAAVAFARRLERWEGHGAAEVLRAFQLVAPLEADLHLDDGSFSLEFNTPGGGGNRGGTIDASVVLEAWGRGESLVPLLEGGWAPLPADWLERHGARVADLLAARHDDGTLPACGLPDLVGLCEELGEPPPPSFDRIRALVAGDALPAVTLPEDLQIELRPYQREGVEWLTFLGRTGLGGLLADDMGLGKTVQALCALRGRTLVVAPTSVLHNWRRRDREVPSRPTHCHVYHGPRRTLVDDADVTLTTYAIMRLDAATLAGGGWETVVLDEAQAIKNPDSQVARAACRSAPPRFAWLLPEPPWRIASSELWSQFNFVNRGLLGSRADFDERYARPIGRRRRRGGGAVARAHPPLRVETSEDRGGPGAAAANRDGAALRSCRGGAGSLRRGARAATLAEVVAKLDAGGSVMAALEALLRLRQAACHRGLLPGNEAADSSKLLLLREVLDSVAAEGRKALVFSQWTSLLDLTEPGLRDAGIDFLRLDGSTRDRQAVVDAFQSDDGPPVLLISLQGRGYRVQPHGGRTTSSCSIRGGTRRWRIRPPTALTVSARPGR